MNGAMLAISILRRILIATLIAVLAHLASKDVLNESLIINGSFIRAPALGKRTSS